MTLPVFPDPLPIVSPVPSADQFERACGDCTACCLLLAVVELNKPMRFACDHQGQGGCRIYSDRPPTCREFDCGWRRGEVPTGDDWRPDRRGVMHVGWTEQPGGQRRDYLFELWPGALSDPAVVAWLQGHTRTSEITLSYRNGTWQTLVPDGTDTMPG
ncbi:MAG: hypothetical protein ACK50P_21815 [Planctomycetaceae bacterium]|jgi:hypothetical protein